MATDPSLPVTRLACAHAPDAGLERGLAAQHVHGFHVQPSITPRAARRPVPVQVPALRRGETRPHGNPYQAAASVAIADGPDARVTDVHIAGQDGVLKLAGTGAGWYEVPASGTITVAWLGNDIPAWDWAIIPGTGPGQK